MPAGHGLCFVVILHLAPDRPSLLADIIGHWTDMMVETARDGACMQADRVYVVPPASVLTIARGCLRVHPRDVQPRHLPIDTFFASLAADLGAQAIGVVLSGMGTDGALGLKAIHEAGGLTFAQGQEGSQPHYAAMPQAAIATGAVDAILPVDAIPARILDLQRPRTQAAADPAPVAAMRLDVCALLHGRTGHDFSHHKQKTFLRRVQRRMEALGLDADAYAERLRTEPAEIDMLFRDLLIGVTSFFRDPEVFAAASGVLAPLFEGKGPDECVRAWIPGCSTGEEAYSLAMLLREQLDRLPVRPRLQIFATDIDEAALTIARGGRYPAPLLKDVAGPRRERFFTNHDEGFIVTRELRDLCTFSLHSVIRDPPFSRIDLVSCRNLLIYLDTQLQSHVIPAFHYALNPGGVMLLGRSETITRHANLFSVLDSKNRIYRR